MWLAKWFGRRREDEDDEPARHSPPTLVRVEQPATLPPRPAARTGGAKGFDPYNSGTFQRRNAWERVSKR